MADNATSNAAFDTIYPARVIVHNYPQVTAPDTDTNEQERLPRFHISY